MIERLHTFRCDHPGCEISERFAGFTDFDACEKVMEWGWVRHCGPERVLDFCPSHVPPQYNPPPYPHFPIRERSTPSGPATPHQSASGDTQRG